MRLFNWQFWKRKEPDSLWPELESVNASKDGTNFQFKGDQAEFVVKVLYPLVAAWLESNGGPNFGAFRMTFNKFPSKPVYVVITEQVDEPNPDPWKGWERNKVDPGWCRIAIESRGEDEFLHSHWVKPDGWLVINCRELCQYDTTDEARQAAEGLVRGPVRWADEVEG